VTLALLDERNAKGNVWSLVEWLNAKESTAACWRIEQLIESIKLEAALKAPVFADRTSNRALAKRKQLGLAQERVNRLLRRYRVYPQFGPIAEDFWPAVWMPVGVKTMKAPQNPVRASRINKRIEEIDAALTVFMLTRINQLKLLKRCENSEVCQVWFVAKPLKKRFHDTKCQQQKFRSSTEFKAKRRDYMRGYRILQTRKNVK